MKNFTITTILLLACYSAQAQKGIGVPNPDASAALDVSSNRQGFLPPRLTTTERDAIISPALGLVVFNTTKNCLEWRLATGWYNACGDNGAGIVTTYTCNTAVTGGMTSGIPVSGVSQTITADVAVTGSYDISATANGVTFRGSGNFTATGLHNIVLHATGTPVAAGDHTFTINTSPENCSFDRTTVSGDGVVTGYTCDTGMTGSMSVGVAVSGVTQTITATVATIGSYAISTIVSNGVTFSATGTFTATGPQDIILRASGTPIAEGIHSFVIAGTPSCSFDRESLGTVRGGAGKTWLNKNLGASRVATSSTDAQSYGDYYQWGRGADGHQIPTSGVTGTKSINDIPGHGLFISGGTDWRVSLNNSLWQGDVGINNPCPLGFRVPTAAEWNAEFQTSNIKNSANAYSSVLKLTVAGTRNYHGVLEGVGVNGRYWSSTVNSIRVLTNFFNSSTFVPNVNDYRNIGSSVRCLKD